MSRLSQIPVTVESGPVASGTPESQRGLGGGVTAVFHEIAAHLERLASAGEAGCVDLATMPLSHADYEQLRDALGEGEVDAQVFADGVSRVRETAVHGVWWIGHRDPEGNVLAESIEVTTMPRILRTDEADLAAGVERIRQRLAAYADHGSSAGGNEHA